MNLRHSLLAIATFIVSACSTFDDSAIQQQLKDHEARIAALEKQCSEMKSNINALQTLTAVLQSNDVVTSISQIVYGEKPIGFNVTFAKGAPIQIYFGSDSATPTIGVKQDGGVWYWTLNGEWLKDESGNRIVANGKDGKDGVTPQMKIEDEYWYISYDEGKTWTKLSKATSEPGDGVFKSVADTESEVVFTLQDGTQIIIPKYKKVNITFEYEQGSVIFDDTKIPYTITGEASEYEISALSFSSSYTAAIEKTTEKTGFINISVKGAAVDSQIAIVVTAPDGESTTRVLQISKCIFNCICVNGTQNVDPNGGQVSIDITSNLSFTAEVSDGAEWLQISPSATKSAVKTTNFTLSYLPNDSIYPRSAMVIFKHNGKVIHEHLIYQNSTRPATVNIRLRIGTSTKATLVPEGNFIMFTKGDKISVNREVFEIQNDGTEQILEVPYCEEGYDVVFPAIHTETSTIRDIDNIPYRNISLDVPEKTDDACSPIMYGYITNENLSCDLRIENALLRFSLADVLQESASYAKIELLSPICGPFYLAAYPDNPSKNVLRSSPTERLKYTQTITINKNAQYHYCGITPCNLKEFLITVFDKDDKMLSSGHMIHTSDGINMRAGTFMEVRIGAKQYEATAIDLGLSVKWASINLCASSPSQTGNCCAFAEIEPRLKGRGYDYKWFSAEDIMHVKNISKYNTQSAYGSVDNKTVVELQDDAANAIYGGSWRIPTAEEWLELKSNCIWSWETLDGVEGYKVIGNKPGYEGNFIFLPCDKYAGLNNAWSATYGTSSLNKEDPRTYSVFYLYEGTQSFDSHAFRPSVHMIRPVCD